MISWSRLYYNGSRVTLFVINILIILIGIVMVALMSMSIHGNNKIRTLDKSFTNSQYTQSLLHLIIGIATVFLGVLGALASKLKNQNILPFYVSIMVSLFITTVVNGFTLFFSQKQTKEDINDGMKDNIPNTEDNATWITVGMDAFQSEFECCGVNGWQDWNGSIDSPIPMSCCKVRKEICNVSIPHHLHSDGCAGEYYDYFVFFMSLLESSTIVLAIMEAICIVCCTVILYEEGKVDDSYTRRLQLFPDRLYQIEEEEDEEEEEEVVCLKPVTEEV